MTRSITSVALFCGSNTGLGETYQHAARTLGTDIGRRGITLVFGGTHKGLMGIVADAVLAAGGQAHGIITQRLAGLGHLHPGLTRSEIVPTLRQRKERMATLADAFIAMPGGIGTLEEFMEAWTMNQLGELDKPAGLYDVSGYYQPFMGFVDHMIEQGFLPPAHRKGIVVSPESATLLDGLAEFERVTVPKWL
ncbi:MAG: TIGR00730 family Rossman fold protein [Hyphomicrobiales bacterium]|nr:MAG: TIGR00730 family Rossman fold protein [Hyphomicrobiales bacterium]